MSIDPDYPIVMRQPTGTRLRVLGVTLLLVVAGPFIAMRDGDVRVAFGIYAPAAVLGWFIFAIGMALGLLLLNATFRGLPCLVLDADGLTFSTAYGTTRRLRWTDIGHLSIYSIGYESGVRVTTHDGRTCNFPALDRSAAELNGLLTRRHAAALAPHSGETF